MGTFHATIQVGDREGQRFESVDAMVDTGSTYTWVPRDVLTKLGVQPEFQQQLVVADGRVIERDVAETRVRLDGRQRTTMVVFGDEGSMPLIGAYTLEGFGLAADPLGKRLIPVPGYALAQGAIVRGGRGAANHVEASFSSPRRSSVRGRGDLKVATTGWNRTNLNTT